MGFWWVRERLRDHLPQGEQITPLAATTLTLRQYLSLVYQASELAEDAAIAIDGYVVLNLSDTLLIGTTRDVVYVSDN